MSPSDISSGLKRVFNEVSQNFAYKIRYTKSNTHPTSYMHLKLHFLVYSKQISQKSIKFHVKYCHKLNIVQVHTKQT